MKKLLLVSLCFLMLCFTQVFAQSRTVTGTVTAKEDGLPIPGVTVKVRGTSNGAQTNTAGKYTLTGVPAGATLQFSFIGYETLTRAISISDKPLVIFLPMKRATNTLDQIQTTAYSKTTMRFNTGDISTVSAEEIARNPVPNVLQSLQGRVPGMLVLEQSGKPNSGFQVQIRSLNTLSGGAATSTGVIAQGTVQQPAQILADDVGLSDERVGDVGRRVRVVAQVENDLQAGQVSRCAVVRRQNLVQRVQSLLESVTGDVCLVHRLGEALIELLDDREQDTLAGAEVVLDGTPADVGLPGDLIRARLVVPLLEDALHRGLQHAGPGYFSI